MRHYDYPDDEFDAIDDDGPVPVGAHRAPLPAWRSWVPLLVVLLIVPALAWGAVTLLGRSTGAATSTQTAPAVPAETTPAAQATDSAASEPSAEPSAEPTQEASATPSGNVDYTTGVTVHNGTVTSGLASRTGSRLENAGFTAVTVSPGSYEATTPTVTTVYYASAEQAASAHAAAQALGISEVVESADEAQSNPIVIVLREDFEE
ncbi:MAG: LytR C-terminal domain-containing protein [Actinomyces sp.]|uniref:LytR C-terminal domain-containing protein n=1 Tax=Actinomyces sp. TaxID=29317 RepID=UPI0026DD2326|nr:LytR C-terminal domain-containing protein [Actinomyces sp.]MDO4243987.1 LytR C-terminal domain-containing protein [Actinomyces sp.]